MKKSLFATNCKKSKRFTLKSYIMDFLTEIEEIEFKSPFSMQLDAMIINQS